MKKIAKTLQKEVLEYGYPKRMKVRTLMKRFGYAQRTEDSSRKITQVLSDLEIYINPSIMKIGDKWNLALDDRIKLSHEQNKEQKHPALKLNQDYNDDKWFDNLEEREFRTEREVESKFIIPLLYKLGYTEEDRYDGMTFKAYTGSRPTILETDVALFDAGNEKLDNQVILVVEAKRESRLTKEVELLKAQKQTKSYAIWLSCHFGLVSDGKKIQVLDLFPSIGGMNVLFECNIDTLKAEFGKLYSLIGKTRLVAYYEDLVS